MANSEQTGVALLRIERAILGPFETNCYLVLSGEGSDARAWFVDAGIDPEPLLELAESYSIEPEAVVLTHAHADHIGGLVQIRERFPSIPILLHESEEAWLTDPELNLSAALGMPIVTPPATRLLKGGEVLRLGENTFDVLHTPGHSPGGITLYSRSQQVALVGDTLFAGSIGRFDFPTSNERVLYESIRNVLYTLPDSTRVLPGHMGETTIGQEKRTNPYVRI
jgi:hydroxyacylglutathione hydrolase